MAPVVKIEFELSYFSDSLLGIISVLLFESIFTHSEIETTKLEKKSIDTIRVTKITDIDTLISSLIELKSILSRAEKMKLLDSDKIYVVDTIITRLNKSNLIDTTICVALKDLKKLFIIQELIKKIIH